MDNEGTKKILLIEDYESDAVLISHMLSAVKSQSFSLRSEDSLSAGLNALESEMPDTILLDLGLPDSRGIDTLLRIQEKAPETAIIVLTGLDDEALSDKAIQCGAQDYLVKGKIDSQVLHRSIRYAIERKKAQDFIRRSKELSEARNRVSDLINSTLNIDEIIESGLTEAAKSIHAGSALLIWVDGDYYTVRYGYNMPQDVIGRRFSPESLSGLPEVAKTGKPVISTDAVHDCLLDSELVTLCNMQSLIIYPLYAGGSLEGFLAFINHSGEGPFDELEIDSARKIADSLSLTLDNADLYEECELARKELAVKSEELERSNRDLEFFASIASHDLQEPLVTLALILKLVRKKLTGIVEDKEIEEFLEGAVDTASRLQKMVGNLFDYARVRTKGASFEKADLNIVLDLAIKSIQALIEQNSAVIIRAPLPEASVDPILLSQVFQNLISNAIKYRREAPPEIRISVTSDGREHQFCVSDNGRGIPPEYRDTIFEIFQRFPGNEKQTGTGIGLATCKKIVELHNGKIWVDSFPGKGSNFYFSIPVNR